MADWLGEIGGWLSDQWFKRTGAVCLIVLLLAGAIDSIIEVWGDRRPVGSFFEAYVALVINWGSAFGSIAVAVWGGFAVLDKTNSRFLAWVTGIFLLVIVALSIHFFALQIPGVGWRLERMGE